MIQDLISNIVQNSAGSSPENAQNLVANEQLKGEFSALLDSIKKEGATTEVPNKKMDSNSDQSFTANQEQEETATSEENATEESVSKLEESNIEVPIENDSISLETGIIPVSAIDTSIQEQESIKLATVDSNKTAVELSDNQDEESVAVQNKVQQEQIVKATISELEIANSKGENVQLVDQQIEVPKSSPNPASHIGQVDRDIFRQDNQSSKVQPVAANQPQVQLSQLGEVFQNIPTRSVLTSNVNQEVKSNIEVNTSNADVRPLGDATSEVAPKVEVTPHSIVIDSSNKVDDSSLESVSANSVHQSSNDFKKVEVQFDGQKVNHKDEIVQPAPVDNSQQSKGNAPLSEAPNSQVVSNSFSSGYQEPEFFDQPFKTPIMVVSANQNQIEQSTKPQPTQVPLEFSEGKNPDLIQFIQTHKSEVIKPKEAKEQRFALSMTEQAETRLRLLVDSVRPELLSSREAPVGFITTHSLDGKIQFFNPSLTLNNDQEALLKEFMMESIQGKDQKATEQNLMGYLRLGELPVANATARRAIVSSFAKVMQQEAASSTRQNEQWQKHSFKLDDGNNIDMTTKNVDGILHIKLAASNPELNRLLMSMEQEIKDHLKEELDLELDLQFTNQEQETFSDALGDGSAQDRKNWNTLNSQSSEEDSSNEAVKSLQPSIRNFGYNQMEWTA